MASPNRGVLVGLERGPDGRARLSTLPWTGDGFALRPSGRPFRRVAIFSNTVGARLELALPPGEWRLLFYRHAWSGHVLVRDAASYAVHDLFSPSPTAEEYEVTVTSAGPASPVIVEPAAQRSAGSQGREVWLLDVRKAPSVFVPEAGLAVSETCRLIEGRHGQFLALRTDNGVADELASTGMWEQEQIEIFSRLVRPGETVLDVGANIGHHTVALSKMVGDEGRVLSFEPQMQMFNLLNANIVLNRCRNASPFKFAVGSRRDRMKMNAISYDDFQPFGSLGLQRQGDGGRGENVEVVALDEFLPTLDLTSPATLMKVDVQAHELYVFQGARDFLRQAQPTISFEVGPFWMKRAGYDWREILALLSDIGYSYFDENGSPAATPHWDGESRAEWQFLAVAPRYRERLG